MSHVKIIEGLEPWEIMKRASEGEQVAIAQINNGVQQRWQTSFKPVWNWNMCAYAIVDTSEPVIDWSEFDWAFFSLLGGLPVIRKGIESIRRNDFTTSCGERLRESPFYYWPGGKQPVPDSVEVTIVLRDGRIKTELARSVTWDHRGSYNPIHNIIAFSITGTVE